jgi:hypothetical protein
MKKVLALVVAIGALIMAVGWADENVSQTPLTFHTIRQARAWDTLVIDTGGTTWLREADLIQEDGYWIGGLIKVLDVTSNLTDSTRTITGFSSSRDSVYWSAPFTNDTLAVGDTVEISVLRAYPGDLNTGWNWSIDSATVDTSGVFIMNPGASITSTHLIEIGDNEDSADTKIVLQIALSGAMPNNQLDWVRNDSITYTSQDTVVYKAWGAKQATRFRFILDAVDAPFSASHAGYHYGQVIVDK